MPLNRHRPLALQALAEAVLAMSAALLTLACAQRLAPGLSSAVLAVVLSLSLARSRLDRDRRGRIEAAVVLPLVGLAAIGVGLLLRQQFMLGALVFAVGFGLSVWLRQRGAWARRAADWIDAFMACRTSALALVGTDAAPAEARRALGQARKALREPAQLLDALRGMQRALDEAVKTLPGHTSTKIAPTG